MNRLKIFLRSLPLTLKMVALTGLVGLGGGVVNDLYVTGVVDNLFNSYLAGMLDRQSQEDRLHFDRYLNAFHQVAVLAGGQVRLLDHLDEQQWFAAANDRLDIHNRLPAWFLRGSALRTLAVPRFVLLLDAAYRPREIYHRPQDKIPAGLLPPGRLDIEKSLNQAHISVIKDQPYLMTAEVISRPQLPPVILLLISPVDEELLQSTQGEFPQNLIGLISDDSRVLLTSSNSELLPPGIPLARLRESYVVTGRDFFDYGGAEMAVRIASFVSTAEIEEMAKTFVDRERYERALTTAGYVFLFTLIMLWIARRIRLLTARVDDFSRQALGGEAQAPGSGDRINILQERFQRLTEEVIESHRAIQKTAEQETLRQLELARKERQLALLESVTDTLDVGVMLAAQGEFRPANTVMKNLEALFGNLAGFIIAPGGSDERLLVDLAGREHIFRLSSPLVFADDPVVLASEITAQKQAAKEKQKLEGQLAQAQRMEAIGRLAGGVAHDFNNILTAIIGYAELSMLLMRRDDPLWENLQIICDSGERGAELTKQLLAFSRKQIIKPVVLNLNKQLDNVQKILRRLIGEDIELIVRPQKDLWEIKADGTQLEQVIINLAVNARDAMPAGGQLFITTDNVQLDDLCLQAHQEVIAGDYVRLTFTDSGHGIKKEDLGNIFEPFFTTKSLGKGTGLGLATIYGIVKQNNGYVYVYSEPGHGATFKIYWPRTTEKAEPAEIRNRQHSLPLGQETILLVEDEPQVREFTALVLASLGYQVLEAGDGEEAVEIFEKNGSPVDLLLTDVVMPKMGGRELVDRLRQNDPALKVLFMSGYTEDAIVQYGVLMDNVCFLQKPVSPAALAEQVRAALAGSPAL